MKDVSEVETPLHTSIVEALRATFDRSSPDSIVPIRGGLSGADVFQLSVAGRSYVLRHARPSSENHAAQETRHAVEFECMRIAAERGIAPRVHYAHERDGVTITDFIEGKTLGECLRNGGGAYVDRLAALLRTLHSGPAFPRVMTVPDACIAYGSSLRARGDTIPLGKALFERVEETRRALAPHITQTPCHHDVNPGNILVEDGRLWLIDWNGASAGDPFHDVTTQTVFVYRTPESSERWMRAYLGRSPTTLETARALVSRAQTLTFFAVLFFAHVPPPAGASPSKQVSPSKDSTDPTPDAAVFGAELAAAAHRMFESNEYATALEVLR